MNSAKKIDSLTGLRFVFMLMIVISHLEFCGGGYRLNTYDYLFHNARMAVDFFFMISGFGLTYKCLSSNQKAVSRLSVRNCVGYGWRRLRKIYPLFLVTSLLMIPRVLEADINSGTSAIMAAIKCVPKFAFISTLTQSLTGMTKYSHLFNGVGWFMSTIFVLYILYPYIEKINFSHIRKKPYLAMLVTFVLGFVCRYTMVLIEQVTIFNDLEYGSPCSRIFDFLLGVIICDIYYEKKETNKSYGTGQEVLISTVTIAWWLFRNCFFNGEYDLFKGAVDRIIVIGVIYIFASSDGRISRFLSCPKMVLLGSVSMYIFLIHYCIRLDAEWVLGRFIDKQILLNFSIIAAMTIGTIIWVYALEKLKRRKVQKI